ncbi:unnamed protein product [Rotaria sp. Silwood2]|nr:unnamed protein product [Rotaria sp. Silwood2]CAF4468856.1 unnamed protein product [Rotaria sp. Silwood2]CAF4559845.1 unnamed protein product [Rotaria sp. Silwood2]
MPRPSTASSKGGKDESVRVVVRCRPMSDKEQDSGCERVVDIDNQRRQVSIRRPKNENTQRMTSSGDDVHNFYFDAVYDWKYVKISLLNIRIMLIIGWSRRNG